MAVVKRFKQSFNSVALGHVLDSAVVVLDTSVLLAPYDAQRCSVAFIKNTYEKLINDGRLAVPAHARLEYLARRLSKIRQVADAIDPSDPMQIERVLDNPVIQSLDEYHRFRKCQMTFASSTCNEPLEQLKEATFHLQTNDRMQAMYETMFTDEVVVTLDGSRSDHEADYEQRQLNRVPTPGSKDTKKHDRGIGDYLIWKTILQIGGKRNCSVVFVTQERKTDWCLKSETEISAQPHLVNEFGQASGAGNR